MSSAVMHNRPGDRHRWMAIPAQPVDPEYRKRQKLLKQLRIKLQVYGDRAGEYRWRIRHKNGNILADCGEGYSSKPGCRRALRNFLALLEQLHHMTWGKEKELPVQVGRLSWRDSTRHSKFVIEWWPQSKR